MEADQSILTIEDVVQSPTIAHLCFDALCDGGSLFFTVASHDLASNSSVSEIHEYRFHDRAVRKLTYHHQDSLLQMLPHIPGLRPCLYFLRGGQVHALPLDGGEAVQVTRLSPPIESFKIGYLYDQIYMIVMQNVSVNHPPSDSKNKSSGIVYESLMVRHWNQWNPYAKRNHLFFYEASITSEGLLSQSHEEGIDLMSGIECDCPLKGARFQHHEYSLSPDGSRILICTRPTQNKQQLRDFAWTTRMCIYVGDLRNINEFSWELVSGEDSSVFHTHPIFAPDNQSIAFLRMNRPGFEQDRYAIYIYDVSSKSRCCISDSIDVSFRTMQFGLTSSELFVTGVYHGSMRIFYLRLRRDGEKVLCLENISVLEGDAARPEICFCRQFNALAYTESSIIKPPELHMVDMEACRAFKPFTFTKLNEGVFTYSDGGDDELRNGKQVVFCSCPTMTNGDKLIPSLYQLHFQGAMNDVIHAWYLAPIEISEATPEKSKPMVLYLHGGPQGSVFNSWAVRWNLAWYASQGFAVLAVNFHGSSGFGQEFMDRYDVFYGLLC